MRKGNQTSFKKGEVNNPNGRPKGSFSPLRKQLMELRKLAIKDSLEIYKKLLEKIDSGEAWAYQIYFKELASMPKEWLNEVDTTNVFKDIKTSKDIQHCLITLFESLINDESMSKKEAIDLIKSLNNTEINDTLFKVDKVKTPEEKSAYNKEVKVYTEFKNNFEAFVQWQIESDKLLKLVK